MVTLAETIVEVTWYVLEGTVDQVPGSIEGECSRRKVENGDGGGGNGQLSLRVLAAVWL